MPTRAAFIQQIANQMMKGNRLGRTGATDKQRKLFQHRHLKHIEWAIDNLPGGISAAVPAVVVKCLIRYDTKIVQKFCRSLLLGLFNGTSDPAYLLWRFVQKTKGSDATAITYATAVCATKAYMEGRALTHVRPVKGDIFEWDENWTVPDSLLANWTPDIVPGDVEGELAIKEFREGLL